MAATASQQQPQRGKDTTGAGISRTDLAILLGIVLVALTLRLVYVSELRSSPLTADPQLDELYHDQWGQAIANGERFVEGPYFRAPLYPAFLGAVYKVFGHGYVVPRVIQAVIGALSCGLLFLIGRRLFGRAVATVAGFAAAGYWILIYFDGELLIPTLIVFLDLLLIWLLLRAGRSAGIAVHAAAGVVLGLSAIARPNILLFAPAIVIWLLVAHRRRWKRALLCVVCVTAGCLLVVLPITVRNYAVGDDLVLIASQGGVNFYIGNNPESDGRTAIVPGTPGGWWEGYCATIERAETARGRKLKPSEVSDYYYGQAWEFIRTQPAEFFRLLGLKLSMFWGAWEIGNNKNIHFWGEHFTPILRWLPLGFCVVGPLGIVGLALCWRRRGELFPLWGFILVYMASVVAFFCNARYRVPIVPPLILLATWAVFQGVSAIANKRWKHLSGGVVLLAAAAAFVNVPFPAGGPRNDAQDYVTLAGRYEAQGQIEAAIDAYGEAIARQPDYLTAHYRLGTLLSQAGRLPEAIAELRRAVALQPSLHNNETAVELALAHNNLGTALAKSGDAAASITHFREAIRLDPEGTHANARLNLAAQLRAVGKPNEAIDVIEEALSLRPDDLKARQRLASLLLGVGRYAEAEQHFRTALRGDADNVWMLDGLGAALSMQGRFDEAVDAAHRALAAAQQSTLPADRKLIDPIRRRLELYEAGQPYHSPQP